MEKIIIEEIYGWKVTQGDKYADHLSFDEMLGTIAALTMPTLRPCEFWMRTKEEHEDMRKSWEKSAKDLEEQ